jgi:hypothetical protein
MRYSPRAEQRPSGGDYRVHHLNVIGATILGEVSSLRSYTKYERFEVEFRRFNTTGTKARYWTGS